ncbi:hypothetical protein FSDG_02255 [Fusobacterium animalis 7_1]|uniref:Uncharacterized protein n=1 Tax=Fusobacterium animalis 7_1 TaxID=457405 RepID=A0A140PV80_9FUSO|nr:MULTISPECIES: hypothetical protein [Fusobacterium]EEO43696.1 hypothetical protein FSDG_02255 [Fusobacterium animalis 7_1]EHG18073.2 hypothetical protein HMPREF9369_01895 [Fusobacterium polymorphum F0401]ERT41686.1 hypothetical protein HMPREF1538_00842 [Fusobacterium nucleatum CTI-1]
MKRLILVLLFLFICIQIFSIQSKKNLVKIDIIGKSGIKSYYVNFSNEQNLDSFEIYDVLN